MRPIPAAMGTSMKSASKPDTLVADLIAQIREAEKKHTGELVGATVERYLSQRRWFRNDEIRARIALGCDSLRQSKVSTARRSWPSSCGT